MAYGSASRARFWILVIHTVNEDWPSSGRPRIQILLYLYIPSVSSNLDKEYFGGNGLAVGTGDWGPWTGWRQAYAAPRFRLKSLNSMTDHGNRYE